MASFYTIPKNVYVLLLTILMFASVKCQCLSNCIIFIHPLADCKIPPCTGNGSCEFIYTNFSHALLDLDTSCPEGSVIMYLDGEHFIEQSAYGVKVSKNINIQGQSNAVIKCGNVDDDSNVTDLILFYNSTIVELNSLEFIACHRPIRFDNIDKLMMSECAFRYV